MSELRVLLVEDDGPQARLIVERLRADDGVRVARVCDSLLEAASVVGQGFDAVLLDLGLPDSEGIDTVVALHHAAPRLPIVVLSGQTDVALAIEAMRHGAQDYVVKATADARLLGRALRLAIERKRLQDTEQMLVGVVSHDLRTPLQTIALGTELMLKEEPDNRHAATVRRAALRAIALVNDLLDATRARLAGVLPIAVADVDLSALIEQCVDEARALYPRRVIETRIAGGIRARADGKRVAQVVQNLVGNALQHSPEATPVQVSLVSDGATLTLAVHNRGTPIPTELRGNIFEPLERATTERSHSIGLGLYIAAEIVRAHGGAIDVHSDAETGTTFQVSLPR